MAQISHEEILAMMAPIGTILVQEQSYGIGVHVAINTDDHRPAVYAWVAGSQIIYIGKAGKGIERRMIQHRAGFRHSVRGKAHVAYLAQLASQGEVLSIYAMWPDPVVVNGYSMPSHSAVEEWLIEAADPKPMRNR